MATAIPLKLPAVKPGDPIRAEDFNALVEAIRSLQFSVAPPLNLQGGPSGKTLTLAALPGARLAKTTGTIGAFTASPDTMGSGNITFYSASPSGVLTSAETGTGWNLASDATDGPIASGKWIVVLKVDGLWLVIWVECTA